MRKAQASMEFILSYGWILLIVLATMGTLFYFNFFNTSKYLPDECEFGKNIYCEDLSFQENNGEVNIQLMLRNNLEKPIEIKDIKVFDNEKNELTCDSISFYCPVDSSDANWTKDSGGTTAFDGSWYIGASCKAEAISCDDFVTPGYKEHYEVKISFKRKPADAPVHNITGRAFATVQ